MMIKMELIEIYLKSISIMIGGILGFISGVVGIGGGIFLSPILFLIKAGKPKHVVTTASDIYINKFYFWNFWAINKKI